MVKHDLRCKGTKTDEDLLKDYFTDHCYCPYISCECYVERAERKPLIEKELGMEVIERERLLRRIRGLEYRLDKAEPRVKNCGIGIIVLGFIIVLYEGILLSL